MRSTWLALVFLVGITQAHTVSAAPKLDVVLLLDNSASMLTSDPNNLRLEAVRGFMALLQADDRLAVLAFGDRVKRISDFVAMDAQARLRLEARVLPEMTPSAAYTDLHAPLEQALQLLQGRRAGALPMVVLFTDGRMDMGDAKTDQRLIQELTGDLLPRYRDNGARIYSMAFSDGSDKGLMDSLALNTGGFSHNPKRPEDVWRAFGNLFENIKKPDRLPVKDGRFLVDASVKEFKLLAGGKSASPLLLQSPSGRNTYNLPSERGNPVMTVSNPEPGEWRIANSADDDTVMAESSMDLSSDLPDYVTVGRLPLHFKVWMGDETAQERGPALSRVTLQWWPEQEQLASNSVLLQRLGDRAVFAGQLPPLAAGTYILELNAEGAAVRHSKRLTLRVVPDSATDAAVEAVVPSSMPSPQQSMPNPPVVRRDEAQTAFLGLFRIEDQAAWATLRIVFWSNLVLCAVIGAVLISLRWRQK